MTTKRAAAYNRGIAASAAGRCINGHFIAINFSRAGQAMNSTPAAIPDRWVSL